MSSAGTQKPPASPTLPDPWSGLALEGRFLGQAADCRRPIMWAEGTPQPSTEKGWSPPGRSRQSRDRALESQPISPWSSKGQERDSHIQR